MLKYGHGDFASSAMGNRGTGCALVVILAAFASPASAWVPHSHPALGCLEQALDNPGQCAPPIPLPDLMRLVALAREKAEPVGAAGIGMAMQSAEDADRESARASTVRAPDAPEVGPAPDPGVAEAFAGLESQAPSLTLPEVDVPAEPDLPSLDLSSSVGAPAWEGSMGVALASPSGTAGHDGLPVERVVPGPTLHAPGLAPPAGAETDVPFWALTAESPLRGLLVPAVGLPVLIAGSTIASAALLFALYHRLVRDRLLDRDTRRRVFEWARANPGCTATPVARALGIHANTAQYHLDMLARYGWLAARREGRASLYFPAGLSSLEEKARIEAARHGQENLAFLRALDAAPGLRQSDAAARLGLAKSTVSRRVAILESMGFVRRDGGALRLTPAGMLALAAATSPMATQ